MHAGAKKLPHCPLSLYQSALHLLYCRSQPPLNRLFSAVIREVCSYFPSHLFVIVPNKLSVDLFEVRTETWQSIEFSADSHLGPSTQYLQLGDGKILACGGNCYSEMLRVGSSSNCASLLSLQGEVESLPPMQECRESPGLAKFTTSIFVFGGFNRVSPAKSDCSRSCESFSLTEKEWSDLPDMKYRRSSFSPCVWRGEIYLCGGGSAVVEIYNPLKPAMREVPMLIAASRLQVTFVRGEELVALSNNLAAVFRYEGEDLHTTASGMRILKGYDQRSAVIWAGKVYIPQSGECTAVDIQTLTVVQEHLLKSQK